jgi:hypothetical protein
VFTLQLLGPKEAEMRIIDVDLHTRQQTIAMLDTETGELVEKTLKHEGETVREFYSPLPHPVLVGIEATGSMYWFLELLEELGMERQVGHPTEIRAAEPRKQKHDRRDAALLRKLQVENRFPSFGCLQPNCEICVRCYGTVISGYACGHGYRTRCKPSLLVTAYGAASPCGAKQANRRSRRYRWHRMQLIDGPSCKPCTVS